MVAGAVYLREGELAALRAVKKGGNSKWVANMIEVGQGLWAARVRVGSGCGLGSRVILSRLRYLTGRGTRVVTSHVPSTLCPYSDATGAYWPSAYVRHPRVLFRRITPAGTPKADLQTTGQGGQRTALRAPTPTRGSTFLPYPHRPQLWSPRAFPTSPTSPPLSACSYPSVRAPAWFLLIGRRILGD